MTNLLTQADRPGKADVIETDIEYGPVTAWSFSTMKSFKECKYRVYLQKVKKLKEESGPAAERGTRIHQEAEDYVCGKIPTLSSDLKAFEDVEGAFAKLKQAFDEGRVSLEGEWAYTIHWEPTEWLANDCWVRIKLDAFERIDETSGRVIDYKTGKRVGNEISHGQQGLLYAIGTFLKYPELEFLEVEFWYTDQKEISRKTYTRDQAMTFFPGWHRQGVELTTEKEFDPTPSQHACRWCSFGKGEYPDCHYGV
jgi:hypothetical protein